MAMNNNQQQQQKPATTTQIRNMYAEGMSYLNMRFFNTNLAFSFYPFVNNNGRGSYDLKHGQSTTVNFEGAFALYSVAHEIIDDKVQEINVQIPCASGATLTLERKLGLSGNMETLFTINKNNITIPFKFNTITHQAKENGMLVTKTIEVGLGAFMKTIEGYLNGINADRHLDKLTDDYVKNIQESTPQSSQNNFQNNGNNNYRSGNSNYKKPYNGNNGYRRSNNNGNYSNYNNNNGQQWNSTAASTYVPVN